MLLRLTLALVLLAAPAMAAPLTFDASTVGAPLSNRPGELYMPAGNGPFPGMVVLHGCDGIGRHYRIWARRLAAWGYATILVDSFRPRGVGNVCNAGQTVPPEEQAADGFAAAAYLRTLPQVRGGRIGVIGFSHGGWAVLKAVLSGYTDALHGTPFAAAVAFYPGCAAPVSALVTDTLILIGSADDWTPPQRCERWRDAVPPAGHALRMIVYPGAVHGFDGPRSRGVYFGHQVGRDEAAAEAAITTTQQFLRERLLPGAG
jgi:dienelactone hydrolase